jgi:Pro-kumamolisin, activation domain/IPT/TIG domain
VKVVHRRGTALVAVTAGALLLASGALAPAVGAGAGVAGAAVSETKVPLSGAAPPNVPAEARDLGPAPGGQVLSLDVVLAGQDPAGLAQAVAAVSTPGSPDYHHYLTAAQYAAQFGPSPAEVAQVSSTLRAEGLTVGVPAPGSDLLPVSGTASVVSAAFATPLDSVQSPDRAHAAVVNTATPQVPASVAGSVTGVVGLNGLFQEHAKLLQGHGTAATQTPAGGAGSSGNTAGGSGGNSASGSSGTTPNAVVAHAGTPQACPAAQSQAFAGAYTSTQMSSIFGLDQLFAQGRTGIGQSIAVVEFEQYLSSDFATFQSCYGLTNPIRNVVVDGGPSGPGPGSGEAALDTEMAAVNAPSAGIVVYEAPNGSDAATLDLYQRIATDDAARVVTTSWGACEALSGSSVINAERGIFDQMSLQGQTVIAASGDSGSEDCYPANGNLAVDDPGSQPDVVSAGGTTMISASASSQLVWNSAGVGAGGGGYSGLWPLNPGQPTPPPSAPRPCGNPSGCRAVPDFSYPANPNAGAVVAYYSSGGGWTAFGGTSVGAPTNAGLFADTNQGCFSSLGRVGPALYAAGSSGYTDITIGNNDYTGGNLGQFVAGPGYDAASGLGTPIDQNLSLALQTGGGCPSVAAISPNTGPIGGAGAVTLFGGGFADASSVTFGSVGTGQIVGRTPTTLSVIPPIAHGPLCVDVTVANPRGVSALSPADHYGFGGDLNCGQGYRFVASDGGVFDFGTAGFWGSAGSLRLNAPVVGMAVTPSTNGYWLAATDGGIFTYGDARFLGSRGGQPLNKPVVGMAATLDGSGYWLVASDGGIFSYGDAQFYGSTGGMQLNKPIVGMAATPDGRGYWLVASDGGIFSFGDAQFHGSTGSLRLNSPVVGMAAAPDGNGYWMVASDGGIFDYGSAGFFGSRGGQPLNKPMVGMAATPDGGGYWLVASDGGIFTYGDAGFFGSTGGIVLNKPIVGMTSA